jgi:cation transport ATPase
VGHVESEQAPAPEDEAFVHHPVRAAAHEAAHLREIADKGESPATPAIVAAAVLAFVIPFAATLMVVAFTVAHFA